MILQAQTANNMILFLRQFTLPRCFFCFFVVWNCRKK